MQVDVSEQTEHPWMFASTREHAEELEELDDELDEPDEGAQLPTSLCQT